MHLLVVALCGLYLFAVLSIFRVLKNACLSLLKLGKRIMNFLKLFVVLSFLPVVMLDLLSVREMCGDLKVFMTEHFWSEVTVVSRSYLIFGCVIFMVFGGLVREVVRMRKMIAHLSNGSTAVKSDSPTVSVGVTSSLQNVLEEILGVMKSKVLDDGTKTSCGVVDDDKLARLEKLLKQQEKATESLRNEMTLLGTDVMQKLVVALPSISSISSLFADVDSRFDVLSSKIDYLSEPVVSSVEDERLDVKRHQTAEVSLDEQNDGVVHADVHDDGTVHDGVDDNDSDIEMDGMDLDNDMVTDVDLKVLSGKTIDDAMKELREKKQMIAEKRRKMPLTVDEKLMSRHDLLRHEEHLQRLRRVGQPENVGLTEEEQEMPRIKILQKLRKEEADKATIVRMLDNPDLENSFKFCQDCQKRVRVDGHQCIQAGWITKRRRRGIPGKEAVVVSTHGRGAMHLKKLFKPDVDQLQKELKEMTAMNERLQKQLAVQPAATVVPVQSQVGYQQHPNFNRMPTTTVPPPPPPFVANVNAPQRVVYPFRYGIQ